MAKASHVQFRIDPEAKARLAAKAEARGVSMSELLRQVVEQESGEPSEPVKAGGLKRPDMRPQAPAEPPGRFFRCPMPGCDFTPKSPRARCGVHGRTVVSV